MNMEKDMYKLGVVRDELNVLAQEVVSHARKKLEEQKDNLVCKNFYSLRLFKKPSRINYHKFDVQNLQEISRKLVNGLSTLGSTTNRDFWKRNFLGSVRTTSINQENPDDFPIFTLNYLLYSDYDNLDVTIKNNLFTRIKLIDPTLLVEFNYEGKLIEIQLENILKTVTDVDFQSPGVKKMGDKNVENIFNNYFQRPTYLGEFYKSRVVFENQLV